MPANVFKALGEHTAKMAYKSALYQWSLSGDVPQDIKVKPVDPWPGNSDGARFLCNGSMVIDDFQADLHTGWHILRSIQLDGWGSLDLTDRNVRAWLPYLHGFSWLRDLRALGGDVARRSARALMLDWIKNHGRWDENVWHSATMGRRLSMWISLYDFYGDSADDDFQFLFFEAIICQARHLARALSKDGKNNCHSLDLIRAVKGLLYSGLAFEGEEIWMEQALDILRAELPRQIAADGAHASRSPQDTVDSLQLLLDIRGALAAAKYPPLPVIQHTIDRLIPAVKFFRYSDKHFALFNGAQEGNQVLVDCILGQAKSRSKALQSLPISGYEKVTVGRTTLMMDCGRTPEWPYDRHAHAAPLAFEMCYGKERVFVSCGSHPTCPEWKGALRGTAAHNTATIGYRNACEIRDDGFFARKVTDVSVRKDVLKQSAMIDASHNGYTSLNGVTHRRRIFLEDDGTTLRGEEIFSAELSPTEPLQIALRFHIHPKVLVSLISHDEQALMRLGNGMGWKFTLDGAALSLENSIYLGEGIRPRKTKQLVLYNHMTDTQVKITWSLKKTG